MQKMCDGFDQLGKVERLIQPHRATRRGDVITQVTLTRHDGYRNARRACVLAQAIDHLEASYLGHQQIAENDIRQKFRREIASMPSVATHQHAMALGFQHNGQQLAKLCVIINHEDGFHDETSDKRAVGLKQTQQTWRHPLRFFCLALAGAVWPRRQVPNGYVLERCYGQASQ